jgi:hypothetical protein
MMPESINSFQHVPELSIFARNYPFLPETISPETIQKVKKNE